MLIIIIQLCGLFMSNTSTQKKKTVDIQRKKIAMAITRNQSIWCSWHTCGTHSHGHWAICGVGEPHARTPAIVAVISQRILVRSRPIKKQYFRRIAKFCVGRVLRTQKVTSLSIRRIWTNLKEERQKHMRTSEIFMNAFQTTATMMLSQALKGHFNNLINHGAKKRNLKPIEKTH